MLHFFRVKKNLSINLHDFAENKMYLIFSKKLNLNRQSLHSSSHMPDVSKQKKNSTLKYIKQYIKLNKVNDISRQNYLFKANNGNTRTMCEMCSKLTIKTPEKRQ